MASVLDTAKYILERRGPLSTMKLQKLCYYAQAWSLVWDDTQLFDEDFQAWANGPVCPELFHQFQGRFSVSSDIAPGDSTKLTDSQRETIDSVLEHYGDKDAQWLSQLTHMEDPWRDARKGIPPGSYSVNTITKESMAIYYGGLE